MHALEDLHAALLRRGAGDDAGHMRAVAEWVGERVLAVAFDKRATRFAVGEIGIVQRARQRRETGHLRARHRHERAV